MDMENNISQNTAENRMLGLPAGGELVPIPPSSTGKDPDSDSQAALLALEDLLLDSQDLSKLGDFVEAETLTTAAKPMAPKGAEDKSAAPSRRASQRRRQKEKRRLERETASKETSLPKPPQSKFQVNKRQRSEEEQPSLEKQPKRQRKTETYRCYRDAVVSDLKVAVVDTTDTLEWRMSEEKAKQMLADISDMIEEHAATSTIAGPRFVASGVIRGHILITCEDETSKQWLQHAIAKIAATNGNGNIKMVKQGILSKLTTAKIVLTTSDAERALVVLNNQNPELKVSEWRLFHSAEIKDDQVDQQAEASSTSRKKILLVLGVNQETAKLIEKKNHTVNYLLKRITVKLEKAKGESSNAAEADAGKSATQPSGDGKPAPELPQQ